MLRRASVAASQFEIIGPLLSLAGDVNLIWWTCTSCHEVSLAEMPYFPQFRTCSRTLMSDALDRDRSGFAAADAERGDTAFEILRFQGVQQRHDQPRAGCADGMAERTG